MNEILLVDKPAGWTSFDVVAKIRSIFSQHEGKKVKVGHAGTLDPFATGLLIVLVGAATKKQNEFIKLGKEYETTLKLGFESTTGDPEGKISRFVTSNKVERSKQISPCTTLSRNDIDKALQKFTGKIEQIPPAYSAIKINGQRAYKLARQGKKVELEPRKVAIKSIDILSYKWPDLKIKVKCSSGTYVRSLAQDIGKELGCGAYLTALRRTKIGKYNIKGAKAIDFFAKI